MSGTIVQMQNNPLHDQTLTMIALKHNAQVLNTAILYPRPIKTKMSVCMVKNKRQHLAIVLADAGSYSYSGRLVLLSLAPLAEW